MPPVSGEFYCSYHAKKKRKEAGYETAHIGVFAAIVITEERGTKPVFCLPHLAPLFVDRLFWYRQRVSQKVLIIMPGEKYAWKIERVQQI